jgi:hypothetical protein
MEVAMAEVRFAGASVFMLSSMLVYGRNQSGLWFLIKGNQIGG